MLFQHIETPLGIMTAQWNERDGTLRSFQFGKQSDGSPVAPLNGSQALEIEAEIEIAIEKAIADYFDTGVFQFDLNRLDWSDTPAFHRRVLERCYEIPSGSTLTYGQLAAEVGSPQAARAVGQAMARNPWPIVVPCHRVVGTSGRLTGYSGVGGIDTKRWLLEHEREHCEVVKTALLF